MFPDETGLLTTPLVRATWAPRGVTPKRALAMRQRRKISVIGTLCVSPGRRRVRLFLAFFPDDTVDGELMAYFLGQVLRHLRGPVAVVWDRLGAHRGEEMDDFLAAHPRVRVWEFPAYCPELDPTEWVWRWLKWDRLANFAPPDVEALAEKAEAEVKPACSDQALLRSFIELSELPLQLVPP